MFFSSVTDENTVDISLIYQRLLLLDHRLILRDKWSKLAQIISRKNRLSIANKLIQYEKTCALYKRKKKRKIFDRWKFRKRWIDFCHQLKRKEIYKLVPIYQNTQKKFSNRNKRAIWKKLTQMLVRRNRFTYLIVDVSDLFKFRTMRTCFRFWFHRFSFSSSLLRNKWHYLVSKRVHREMILRIYNVQSVFHTRIIWRDFVDRILHQYHIREIQNAKNDQSIRQRWIFLSSSIIHKQILNRLYQVRSQLKTRVVWKYFVISTMVKYKRSIFINSLKQYKLRKEKRKTIIAQWEKIFYSLQLYSHQQSIRSITHYLEIRSSWRSITRKLYFYSLRKLLNEKLKNINDQNEELYEKSLLKKFFNQWFWVSVSDIKMRQVYDDALSLFVPAFRHNSALVIQRIFRLYLRHQKAIRDMIFSDISLDSFSHPFIYQTMKHFLPPFQHPKKIWNPFVNQVSNSVAQTNYQFNYSKLRKIPIRTLSPPECFPRIILKKLKFFSTEKDFPTPQLDQIIEDFDFNDFDVEIESNIKFYKKEIVPKFTERRIQEDVIQYIKVDPDFKYANSQTFHFNFIQFETDELIEKVLEEESNFEMDDVVESWVNFSDLTKNTKNHLNDFSTKNKPPKSEKRFQVFETVSEDILNSIEYIFDQDQLKNSLNSESIQFSMNNYHPIQFIEQDEYDHIFDKNENFYLTIDDIDSLEIDTFPLVLLRFIEIRESVFRGFNLKRILSGEDDIIQFVISPFRIQFSLPIFKAKPTLVDALFHTGNERIFPFLNFKSFIFTFSIDFVCHFKTFRSQCVDIKQQHNEQVSALEFEVDDRLLKRKRNFILRNSLFQTGTNLLFDKMFFIRGFFFGPKVSVFSHIERAIDRVSYSEMISMDSFDFSFPASFASPIRPTINKKIKIGHQKTVDMLESEVPLNDFEFKFHIKSLRTLRKKRKKSSKNSIQEECLNKYSNQLKEPLFEMDLGGLNQNLNQSSFFNMELEKRPKDAISSYVDESIDSSILTLFDFTFSMPALNFSRKDDKSFLVVSKLDSIAVKIVVDSLNHLPIVSNRPSLETICEITSDFLSTVPLSPPRILRDVRRLEFLDSKDPVSLIDQSQIESQVDHLLKEIQYPLTSNKVTQTFDVGFDVDFTDLISGISRQISVGNLAQMTPSDERALVNNDVLFGLLDSSQQSILSSIPLNSNLPQEETLIEISDDFAIFQETIESFSMFGLDNVSLLNYSMKDDRIFHNDEFNDHFALKIFNEEMDHLPLVANVPSEEDIVSIAGEFYDFCDISTKVPLSPIKRIEMKDDRSFFSNEDVMSEFSSLLNSIDLPVTQNLPGDSTADEIATVFYDASDIICYFSSLENLVPLILFERREDISFANPILIDNACNAMLDQLSLPIELNKLDKKTLDQISLQLSQIIEENRNDFALKFTTQALNFGLNYHRKDDRSFIDNKLIEKVVIDSFDSIFNEGDFLCLNEPEEKDVSQIVDGFCDFNVEPFSKASYSPLSRMTNKDERIYINTNIIDGIMANIYDKILQEEKILCLNRPEEGTITEIASDLVDSEIDSFSDISLSSLDKYEPKDSCAYLNSNLIDKIIFDIFDSIFNDEKIFCLNLLNDETTNEISTEFVDTNVAPFSTLDVSSLLGFQIKDDQFFLNRDLIEKIPSNILNSILNEEKILCSNEPDEKTVDEVIDNFFDFNVAPFSKVNCLPLSNLTEKDVRTYIDSNTIENIFTNIFDKILEEEKILYLNSPEEETISEIITGFVDSHVDPFSIVDVSSLSKFELKDDRSFIEIQSLRHFEDQFLNNELNSIPIVSNNLDPENAMEIIDVPEFNESFADYGQFLRSNQILAPIKNFDFKDDRSLSSWKEVDKIANSIIPDDLPIAINDVSENEIREIFNVINFKEALENVVSSEFKQNRFHFYMNDDRAFISEDEIEALYYNIFFSAIDAFQFEQNIPSDETIQEIVLLDYNENYGILNEINPALPLLRYEKKGSKTLFSNENADNLFYSFFDAIQLPIVENDVDESMIDEITSYIIFKNNVFDLNLNTCQCVDSLNLISPNERKINIDDDIVYETTIFEINMIIHNKLPIVRNTVTRDEINQILTVVDRQLQLPIFEKKQTLAPLMNIDPTNRKIEVDEEVFLDLASDIFEDSISKLTITLNTFDNRVPFDVIKPINLFSAFSLLPQINVKPMVNLSKAEKRIPLNEDFYESLLLKILYEYVLPVMPIRKRQKSSFVSFEKNIDSKTEIFFDDEDYNDSY